MTTDPTVRAHGTLGENGDTFFLMTPQKLILIDAAFPIDAQLLGETVSVIGKMGNPPSAPGITKLLVDRIISQEAIAVRAFGIFKSGAGGSQNDHWFRAERELLSLPIAKQPPPN